MNKKAPPTDRLIETYVKIRDRRAEIKNIFEAEDRELRNQLNQIEIALLDVCRETGTEKLGTAHGTASRVVKTRYTTTDWDSFYQFMEEHKAYELLEKRVSQTNIAQFLQEHPELKPDFVNVDRQYQIQIRRK